MSKLYSSLSVITFLALGTTLNAQESTTDTDTTSTEAEAGAAAETETPTVEPAAEENAQTSEAETTVDAESNTAEASDQDQVAQPAVYIGEQYGDWQLKCYTSDAEKDPCNMFQLLSDQSGNPVATIDMFKLPEGSPAVAGATIAVPLRTLLTQDLKIAVDGGQAKVYEFSYCDQNACYSQLGFTQEDINAFKAGNTATMQIVPADAPDRFVNISVSLDGFTAAYNSEAIINN